MSGADRKTIRAAAYAALAGATPLAGFTEISAWVQSVDVSALPAFGVATPRETRERDSHTTSQNGMTLAVVVKRLGGGDIEDVLDDDSDAIEGVLLPVLRGFNREFDLTSTEVRVDGDGAQRVGTLTMAFTVTYWVDDPV